MFLYDRLPAYSFLHKNREVAHKFARQMLADKDVALAKGSNSHDIMSIIGACDLSFSLLFAAFDINFCCSIVRANVSEDERSRLTDYEMVSQMRYV